MLFFFCPLYTCYVLQNIAFIIAFSPVGINTNDWRLGDKVGFASVFISNFFFVAMVAYLVKIARSGERSDPPPDVINRRVPLYQCRIISGLMKGRARQTAMAHRCRYYHTNSTHDSRTTYCRDFVGSPGIVILLTKLANYGSGFIMTSSRRKLFNREFGSNDV